MPPRIVPKSSIVYPKTVGLTAAAQPGRQQIDSYVASAAPVCHTKPILSSYFNTKSSLSMVAKLTPLVTGSSCIGVGCLVALNVPGLREALVIGGAALLSLSICHMALTLVWAAIQRRVAPATAAPAIPVVTSTATATVVTQPAVNADLPQLPTPAQLVRSASQPRASRRSAAVDRISVERAPVATAATERVRTPVPEIDEDGTEWWPIGHSPRPVADAPERAADAPEPAVNANMAPAPVTRVVPSDDAVALASDSATPPPDTMLLPLDRVYSDLVLSTRASVAAVGATIGGLWKSTVRSVSESNYKVPARVPLVSAAVVLTTIIGTVLTVHMASES